MTIITVFEFSRTSQKHYRVVYFFRIKHAEKVDIACFVLVLRCRNCRPCVLSLRPFAAEEEEGRKPLEGSEERFESHGAQRKDDYVITRPSQRSVLLV